MYISSKAIVLSSVRYQEKSLIVKCFTEKDGVKTYFVKNAFSKSKTQNISYFQPLTLLQIQYKEKNSSTLNYFHSINLLQPYTTIYTDFNKSIVVMFLAEILNNILQEDQHSPDLFTFLENSFIWYDMADWNPDFHLYILFQVTKFLGFYPDDNFTSELYFNKKEGAFTNVFSLDCFNEEETNSFKKGLTLEISEKRELYGKERKNILHTIIEYYQTHQKRLKKINSLEVVSELF